MTTSSWGTGSRGDTGGSITIRDTGVLDYIIYWRVAAVVGCWHCKCSSSHSTMFMKPSASASTPARAWLFPGYQSSLEGRVGLMPCPHHKPQHLAQHSPCGDPSGLEGTVILQPLLGRDTPVILPQH